MSPTWFQGFNLAFQIIFFIITLSISYTAFRAYQFFAKERHKYLSLGFAVFALSYVADIVSSSAHIIGGAKELAIGALYVHAYLFLAGVLILLFVYLKIEQPAVRAVLVILVLGFIAVFTRSSEPLQDAIFQLITAILLLFIVGRLTQGYKRTCKTTTLCVTIGFGFLTAGQLAMIFTGAHQLFFVASALLTLFGFLSIAVSRIMVK